MPLRQIVDGDGTCAYSCSRCTRTTCTVRESLKAGAKAVRPQATAPTSICIAGIKSVASGRPYFSAMVERLDRRVPETRPRQPWKTQVLTLTGREREVVQLVAEGRNTRQIARLLGVAAATVSAHRAGAMMKLGLHNTAEIVRFAVRTGVVR